MQEQWWKAKKWSGELLVRAMGFVRTCSLCLVMCHFTLHFLELAPDFWLVESGRGLITSLASSPLYHVSHLWGSGSHLLKVFFFPCSCFLSFFRLLYRAWKCMHAPNGLFPIIQVILFWLLKAEYLLVGCCFAPEVPALIILTKHTRANSFFLFFF